jgi:hypothetical protein
MPRTWRNANEETSKAPKNVETSESWELLALDEAEELKV